MSRSGAAPPALRGAEPGPPVSVLLASRNGEHYLEAALDSLAAQTLADFEIVAVDDGSTDRTGAILARFAASRPQTRVIRTGGLGLAGALALAAREARGPLLARQDDDDLSHSERLERQAHLLSLRPEIGVVGTAADLLDEHGARIGIYPVPIEPGDILRVARRDPPFVHGSVMMRRTVYEAAGGYREAFRSSEDLDLWLRMPPAHFANLPERLYAWRFNPSGAFAAARALMLDFAAIARALAEERLDTGTDSYPLLERCPDRDTFLDAYPRAGRLALHLGRAYLRDGRRGEARAFLARARHDPAVRTAALTWWLLSWPAALTPRARGAAARGAAPRGRGR